MSGSATSRRNTAWTSCSTSGARGSRTNQSSFSTKPERGRTAVLVALAVLLAVVASCGRPAYDLTVRVTDEGGSAVPQALVVLDDDFQDVRTSTDAGTTAWTDLQMSAITLTVYADGFLSRETQVSLERGHNEAVVALERAPIDWKSLSP